MHYFHVPKNTRLQEALKTKKEKNENKGREQEIFRVKPLKIPEEEKEEEEKRENTFIDDTKYSRRVSI